MDSYIKRAHRILDGKNKNEPFEIWEEVPITLGNDKIARVFEKQLNVI